WQSPPAVADASKARSSLRRRQLGRRRTCAGMSGFPALPFVPAKAGTQSSGLWSWIPSTSAFTRVHSPSKMGVNALNDALCAGMSGVFAALSPRCRVCARSMRELERDHADDDERGAEPAPEVAGIAEKPHPHQEGSGSADAGPNRVRGAERNVPLRQKEQADADRERD